MSEPREGVIVGVGTSTDVVPENVARRLPANVTRYASQARSANTHKAYTSDWVQWEQWCRTTRTTPLPANPVDVAAYIAEAADLIREDGRFAYSVATLSRWVASIGYWHTTAGHPKPGRDPVVAQVLSGIRRERTEKSVRPLKRQAKPLMLADLKRTLAAIPTTGWPMGVIGVRDVAILLTGWAGALRSANVAGIVTSDLTWHPDDGVWIRLRRSKTDQEGKGRMIAVPRGAHLDTCTPCALTRWATLLITAEKAWDDEQKQRPEVMAALMRLNHTRHVCLTAPDGLDTIPEDAPLFRAVHKTGHIGHTSISPDVVNQVVHRRTKQAGLTGYTSHSMRAGFVTEASRQGLSTEMIMRQTGQTKDTVEIYRRHQQPLEGNAVTHLGL